MGDRCCEEGVTPPMSDRIDRQSALALTHPPMNWPTICLLFAIVSGFYLIESFRKRRSTWPFSRKGPSGFSSSSTAEEVTRGIDGTGLTAIVTGASSGIGAETARVLALRGVHVIMAARSLQAAEDVKEAIIKEIPTAKVDVMELDLSSKESVQKFASEFNSSGLPLNILMKNTSSDLSGLNGRNNAGILGTPFMLSKDNIELQFATNHLGHFLLTNLLLDTMKKTAHESKKEGRIVNVSSESHNRSYRGGIRFDKINDKSSYSSWPAYGQSKLANVLHANELTRRLKVSCFSFAVMR
ncbi:hypothetical protein L6164_008373 [Bauhinia variegata]|uniref:Uncharacterized protein n=1 Tax=Bauhinia variegata TaxID=167791 RepID=A0ACB9PHU5_BAUVA|nr:hypothetical protein L6164_008373 [Bauhinia variegata]